MKEVVKIAQLPLEPGDSGGWEMAETAVFNAVLRCLAERQAQRVWVKRTVQSRRVILVGFANFVGPGRDTRKITKRDVERWMRSKKGVTDSTLRTQLSVVKVFFDWAVEKRLARNNPAATIRPPHEPPRLPRGLSEDQVEKILSGCHDQRTRLMVLLQVLMGLRVGEVVTVQLGNIDFARRSMLVVGKGRWERELPIPDQAFEAIMAYRATIPSPNAGPLIRSETDPLHPISAAWACQIVSQAMEKAGVSETSHSLRHTLATNMVDDGVSIRTVQAVLGHQSLKSTQRYIGTASLDEKRAAMNRRY